MENSIKKLHSEAMEASLSVIFFFLVTCFPFFTFSRLTYNQTKLPPGVVGPESFALDCNGEGPYTGVSDGRIFKWQGVTRSWMEFAFTAPIRRRKLCDGSTDPKLEPICGRPLGLQFNKATCDLYIADAYFGLMKVGQNGGVAMQLATRAAGVPFNFTNSLDIDQETGVVYFTDSSTRYQRSEHLQVVLSGDNTGRFMKYDPQSGQVTVLLRGLQFANGVALSKDKSYVLVAETSRFGILRYWLKGFKARKSEVFSWVPGAPDNIKRNSKGQYWVGLNNGGTTPSFVHESIAVRLDGGGKVLETLRGDGLMESVSEVAEINGHLLVGSVGMPYVGASII